MSKKITYSVVIAVYNEASSLQELYSEIKDVFKNIDAEWELIFVDDGSMDDSRKILKTLAEEGGSLQVISFSRNYGKAAVYMAGFEACKGDIVITLDGDLQDVPAEIPKLLTALDNGLDLVIGWKQQRFQNEPLKKIPSLAYNLLKKIIFKIGLHDSNCGFRAMRSHVAKTLDLYGDRYRFIPELASIMGFAVGEIPIEHRVRKHGVSKYGALRFLTGFLDLLSVRFLSIFALKPLHFFGALAILPFIFGSGLEIYVLLRKFQGENFQTHIAAIVIGVLFIVIGLQFLGIGLIGEMICAHSEKKQYNKKVFSEKPLSTQPGAKILKQ